MTHTERNALLKSDREAYIKANGPRGVIKYLRAKYGMTEGALHSALYGRKSRGGKDAEKNAVWFWYVDSEDGQVYYGRHPIHAGDRLIGPCEDPDMAHAKFSDGHKFGLKVLTKH